MQFSSPLTLNEMPLFEDFLAVYKKEKFARIVYDTHVKVYWRTIIAEKQNNLCFFCKCEMTFEKDKANSATIEHLIPRSEGGPDDPENYAVSCMRCNNKRGTMSVNSFMSYVQGGGLDHPELSKTKIRKLRRLHQKGAVDNGPKDAIMQDNGNTEITDGIV